MVKQNHKLAIQVKALDKDGKEIVKHGHTLSGAFYWVNSLLHDMEEVTFTITIIKYKT